MKTKQVKAFLLNEGDHIYLGKGITAVIDSVSWADKQTLKINYENGAIGYYSRENKVLKIVNENN